MGCIYLKKTFKILSKLDRKKPNKEYTFKISDKFQSNIVINPFSQDGFIISEINMENIEVESLSEEELYKYSEEINGHITKLLAVIKYYFEYRDLPEDLFQIEQIMWSHDNINWINLEKHINLMAHPIDKSIEINDNAAVDIQNILVNKIEPFIALRYLHLAMSSNDPVFKWLDAAIAAELAIKEYLIIKDPSMKDKLEKEQLYVVNLYDVELKQYLKKSSCKLKEIKNGASIRNKIVHSPKRPVIAWEDAVRYVDDVKEAIYELILDLTGLDLQNNNHRYNASYLIIETKTL